MGSKVIDYSSAFLKLNISGKRYKMLKSTALRYHKSLFSELANLDGKEGTKGALSPAAASCCYLVDSNEYYLERSPAVFDYVLHYAYTGLLHCPSGLCKEMLMEELEFWRLTHEKAQAVLAKCCQDGEKEEDEGQMEKGEDQEGTDGQRGFMGKIWLCCEDPTSSVAASLLNIVSIFFILLSIVNLILSTVKSLQHCEETGSTSSSTGANTTNITNVTIEEGKNSHEERCEGGPIFETIEAICIGWFTLELVARFIACPNKGRFFKSALNIIDILATLPFYIELILQAFNVQSGQLVMIYAFRLLRILRIMRALRLARYFESVRIMGETFKRCRKDLGVLVVFVCMAMIIGSSVVYYFERDEDGTAFTSIPASFWWCIVTLTTVGYGDVTPTTPAGRVCTGVVCVVGVILLAMPISILVEQFDQAYKSKQSKAKKADVGELIKKATASAKASAGEVAALLKADKQDQTAN